MPSSTNSTFPLTTLAPLLLGLALALGGSRLDGFVGGACQGAGIMLILISVYVLGSRMRPAKKDDDSLWLPSQDKGQQ